MVKLCTRQSRSHKPPESFLSFAGYTTCERAAHRIHLAMIPDEIPDQQIVARGPSAKSHDINPLWSTEAASHPGREGTALYLLPAMLVSAERNPVDIEESQAQAYDRCAQ